MTSAKSFFTLAGLLFWFTHRKCTPSRYLLLIILTGYYTLLVHQLQIVIVDKYASVCYNIDMFRLRRNNTVTDTSVANTTPGERYYGDSDILENKIKQVFAVIGLTAAMGAGLFAAVWFGERSSDPEINCDPVDKYGRVPGATTQWDTAVAVTEKGDVGKTIEYHVHQDPETGAITVEYCMPEGDS